MGFAAGTATDWTNGTGVFPTGGVITIPADTGRQWFYVENRDVGEVAVAYTVNYATGGSGASSPIDLDPAAATGRQGGIEERDAEAFMPARGVITITGTAAQKVTVLTANGN